MKKGALAPHYGRVSTSTGADAENVFRSGPRRAPSIGAQTYSVLAIRASFSDTPIESTTAYYDRLLFFLNQYWSQVSDNQIVLNTTLWDSTFTLPRPMAYYGDDDRFQERLVHLIRDVVQVADSTVNFSAYQGLIVFHAGQGQEADVLDNSRDQVWSAFVTPDDFEAILGDSLGQVGIRTNDFVSPGVSYFVDEAVELPESETQDGYLFGMLGVTAHEFGHQLGRLRGRPSMPDLYDTVPDEGGYNQGLGAFDIMAGGVWNANGFVPAGPSAWTKLWLGLVIPQRVVSDAAGLAIGQLERPIPGIQQAIQIPVTQSEYFLIENRRHDLDGNGRFTFDDQNGDGCFDFYADSYAGAEFDFFLPAHVSEPDPNLVCDAGAYQSGSGVLVYHVDDQKIEETVALNIVNSESARKGVDLVEADGIQDLDGPPTGLTSGSPDDVFRQGWRDKVTPDTTPSTAAYGNFRTGLSITNISAADSVMTLDVSFDRSRAGWPKVLSGRIRSMPALAADLDPGAAAVDSLELIVPVQRLNNTGAVYVFRADGTDFLDRDLSPTPFAVTLSAPSSSPCVGDIDGDGEPELVFQTLNGDIYAFNANGTEVRNGDNDPATVGILFKAPALTGTTRGQPILVDLNGTGGPEIVFGTAATTQQLGGSLLRVLSVSAGGVQSLSEFMYGSTESPPAAADLNGDGRSEILVANVPTIVDENGLPGISLFNWEYLTDPLVPGGFSQIRSGGPYSAPVLADVDGDGTYELMVVDASGAYHAYRITMAPHQAGSPPNEEVTMTELPGWPVQPPGKGRLSEVSVADLEHDGRSETFHTGDQVRLDAFHCNGAPRSGYPLHPGTASVAGDSAGSWAPLLADVDGDGLHDVIAILPDGTRPAFRADGSPVAGFAELGSTGTGAPPILADVDGDGTAEWIEAHDAGPTQVQISIRSASLPVRASDIAWGQYRINGTRNAVVAAGPLSTPGTQILSDVYPYPNPARGGRTTIHYRLSDAATSVKIKIIDPSGSTVAEPPITPANLVGGVEHAVSWNHASMASGIYLCRVEVMSSRGTEVQFTKLAVLR
jgi:M6 family metalloprotease-like protein